MRGCAGLSSPGHTTTAPPLTPGWLCLVWYSIWLLFLQVSVILSVLNQSNWCRETFMIIIVLRCHQFLLGEKTTPNKDNRTSLPVATCTHRAVYTTLCVSTLSQENGLMKSRKNMKKLF